MIRISKKERQLIYRLNTKAKKKSNYLTQTFGMQYGFKTQTPSSFTSRKELNKYKESLRTYTNRYHYDFIQGGIKKGGVYRYAIPRRSFEWAQQRQHKNYLLQRARFERIKSREMRIGGKAVGQQFGYHYSEIYPVGSNLKTPPNPRFQMRRKFSHYAGYEGFKGLEPSYFHYKSQADRIMYSFRKFHNPQKYAQEQKILKQNFMNALLGTFGSPAVNLVATLEKLTPEEFEDFFSLELVADFDFIYDEEQKDRLLQDLAKGVQAFLDDEFSESEKKRRFGEAVDYSLGVQASLEADETTAQYRSHKYTVPMGNYLVDFMLTTKELDYMESHGGEMPESLTKRIEETRKKREKFGYV